MVTVDVLAAVICFMGSCYPALVGKETPRGEFRLVEISMVGLPAALGKTVLSFKETKTDIFAVHKTWPGREQRYSHPPSKRLMTLGCINVEPHVYEKLENCCIGARIQIK